jgi:hypothetical protein
VNLVYYSLVTVEGGRAELQWVQSVRSLRHYNRSIPTYLFVYNTPSYETLIEADRLNVCIVQGGNYRDCFVGMPPAAVSALMRFPTLHRFLSLKACPSVGLSQILFLDCDTFFFGDVAALFDRYRECHFYAREEPNSRRSRYGYDPLYLDEDMLFGVARDEGCLSIPPYNAGVCMFNHGIWQAIAALSADMMTYNWRLLLGTRYRAPLRPAIDAQLYNLLGDHVVSEWHRAQCLLYPSSNAWIFDQIGLYLTLGRITGLTNDALSREDVVQNGEFCEVDWSSTRPIVAHYYSGWESQFFDQLARL